MDNFNDRAFPGLMGVEGGYVDNPADPGGATRWGTTERVARAGGYTGDMKDFPQDWAQRIAKTKYWDPYRCDELPYEIAYQVFDAAYNGGHPALWLQRALKVTADGQIGAATIAAAHAADPDKVVMLFDAQRLEYMASLGNSSHVFGPGWMNRIAANLRRAANDE